MKYLIRSLLMVHLTAASVLSAVDPITWNLWPGKPPGETVTLPPESYRANDNRQTAGRPVSRLQNVSVPTLTIFKPDREIDTGSSIMIAPGGGFTILAYDKEGTEVADWANSIGMTAIVLKYRVPGNVHNPDKPWLAAAQDGQRAMSLVKSRSDEVGISPDRIGIMGFSAGGAPVMYTALVSDRLYDSVDNHDDHNFRPAFAAPIYSGWWVPEEASLSEATPPFFMVITYDDKDRSIGLSETYIKLKKAKVSAEMHIYSEGGHGYGLRRTEKPVTSWNDRMEDWLRLKGFLDK